MKVIKESTEKLPINVVTDFVSEGWNEVGKLKSEIEAIKGFKDSSAVAEVLQKLTDSYLVCIGQLEAFLADKKYIKEPEELKEDINININDEEIIINDGKDNVTVIPMPEEGSEAEEEIEAPVEVKAPQVEVPTLHDTFEYFVDFDEPVETEPITDAEIEQLQKVGR